MYLSIVIPAFNEEKRIGQTLLKIHGYLQQKNIDYEVIMVDDGSTDSTATVAQRSDVAKTGKLKVIHNIANRGKGYSVKTGILNSKGEYVLFTDADLSCPIEELDKLIAIANQNFSIVIGSRSVSD